VGADLLVRQGVLHPDGNIQITLVVTESPPSHLCVDGIRGYIFNTTYHDYNYCSPLSNFTSIYVGTCQYPVSPIGPPQNFIFWADVDNSSLFVVQPWISNSHNLHLSSNVSGSDSSNRVIPLCCGSPWQASINIVSMTDPRWGSASITGELTITFTVVVLAGDPKTISVSASRTCLHGGNDPSTIHGILQDTLYRVTLHPDIVRRWGPGAWYLNVVSLAGSPVEFSYSYAYSGYPWHICPRDCSRQGFCNQQTGLCHCYPCHSGPECEIVEPCSGNGICEYYGNGTCKCLAGTSGPKCEIAAPKEIPAEETLYHDNLTRAGLTFLILGMVIVGIIIGIAVARYKNGSLRYNSVNS